jgi:hypothetical protein
MKGGFKGGISAFLGPLAVTSRPTPAPINKREYRYKERVITEQGLAGGSQAQKYLNFNPLLSTAPPDYLPLW